MSKFFTYPMGLLLALVPTVLALEEMTATPPSTPESAAPAELSLLPGPLKADRYAALGKKSPFTLASATQENADFAKDLSLAGYVRMDGQDFVMVANRAKAERILVGTSPSPSAQGMVLLKIERDPAGDPTKMQVRIRKGTEEATLKYEVTSSAPAVPVPPPGVAQIPGQTQVAVPPQPGIPGQPNVVPGQPGQKNPPVIRRRVIPIPTPPR